MSLPLGSICEMCWLLEGIFPQRIHRESYLHHLSKKKKVSFLNSIQHTVLYSFHCQPSSLFGFKLWEQKQEHKGRSAVSGIDMGLYQSHCFQTSHMKQFILPQSSFLIAFTNCSFRTHIFLNKLNNCRYKWIENYTHGGLFSYSSLALQRAEIFPFEVNLLAIVSRIYGSHSASSRNSSAWAYTKAAVDRRSKCGPVNKDLQQE